jgi:cobalt-zinc-cadmium efflux system membrane fusion protein
MEKDLKYFLFAVIMMALYFLPSCHNKNQGLTEESGIKGSLTEGTAGEELKEIVITREQFESSGMKLGNPQPVMFRQTVSANGYIVASPSGWVKISTLIPGRVKEINLSVGDHIRKGQLLFTLESNEIILLQQEYAESFNQLNSLKASYERQKALSEEQITSQKDFINAESDYRSLLSKTEGLKARLRMINIDPSQVEKGTIIPFASVYSPIQGFVTKQDLVLGQFIEPQAMVMELVDIDQLQLNIHVFEKDLNEMKTGQKVLYYDPDDIDRVFEATLSHIGKSIDEDTKTVLCIAQLKPADRSAFVNRQYVETGIITCQREAPAIPEQALMKEEGRYYVLTLIGEKEENFIFRMILVHVGVIQQDYAEVLDEGLKDILIEGGYNLSTGN